MSIISHISVGTTVENLPLMVELYDAIMKDLGAKRHVVIAPDMSKMALSTIPCMNDKDECNIMAIAYGKRYPEFWIQPPANKKKASPGNGCHVAFNCSSQAQVDRVYKTAMQHGATDNGKPGKRREYSDKYYGAFFIDPCGNKLEAIFLDTGSIPCCGIM